MIITQGKGERLEQLTVKTDGEGSGRGIGGSSGALKRLGLVLNASDIAGGARWDVCSVVWRTLDGSLGC